MKEGWEGRRGGGGEREQVGGTRVTGKGNEKERTQRSTLEYLSPCWPGIALQWQLTVLPAILLPAGYLSVIMDTASPW